MTPQLAALLVADVALFLIAFGVLRLYPRQLATVTIAPEPLIHVKRDEFRIDRSTPHYEAIEHWAVRNHYKFSERRGSMVTYVRDEYHGPTSAWR